MDRIYKIHRIKSRTKPKASRWYGVLRLAADRAESAGSSPREFAAHIKAERDKWAGVIKQTGIKGE